MAKTAAERQRERRAKLKEAGKYEEYKQKASQQKKILRKKNLSTETEKKKQIRREKDKINHANWRLKQKEKTLTTLAPHKAFGNKQALGKALSRARKSLPHSPRKRTEVVQKLANQYSPMMPPFNHKRISNVRIKEETKKAVESFYGNDSISSQAPGIRDFFIYRDHNGKRKVQKRYLQLTVGEVYSTFKEEHPLVEIGFSKFASLRPKHICLRSETPNNMCLCVYHENIRLLLDSSPIFPNTTTEFVKLVVCDDTSMTCMCQTCNECKDLKHFKKFVDELNESQLECEVSYKQWTKSEDGCIVRNKKFGSLNDVLCLLEKQLKYFLWHVYVKNTQAKAFAELKDNLPYGKLLIQTDFSENYCHVYQDEIQSAHWQNTSSTMYTTMVYYRESSTAEAISSDPYVVISDYSNHDKYAVIVFNNLILESFLENHKGFKVQGIEFQSDGTSQHFKQKYTLYSMTLNKLPTAWHFSATSHGKGCVDGLGGTIKRRVREASRARCTDPRTSAEFAKAAKIICPNINILYASEQSIEAVKSKLDKSWTVGSEEIKSTPGTRNAHCFRSCSPGIIFSSLTSICEKGLEFNFKTGECIERELSPSASIKPTVQWKCGQWVTVKYDNHQFLGLILEIVEGQCRIKCLEPSTTKGLYKFESDNHAVWYQTDQILAQAEAPTLVNSRGFYRIEDY